MNPPLPPSLESLPESFKQLLITSPERVPELIRQELEARRETDRMAFFLPNGGQERYIQTIGYYRPFISIWSAANGLGKTTVAANLTGRLFFGGENPAFDFDIFKNWPYPKRARYITDPKLVEEIGPWHSEVTKWWPRGRYTCAKGSKTWFSIYRGNGWLLDVMTYDQAPKDFEGATLGLAIFDEPPPQIIWNATVSRMRAGGMIMVLMTPLTSAAWFFDQVVPKHLNHIVYGDIEENCREHGKNGQLNHVDIERMLDAMPQEEREARAHGKALALAYLIYKAFDVRIHVTPEAVIPPPGAQVWQIVDPHIDKPFACIWGYPAGDGSFVQFDEYPNDDFYSAHNCSLGIADYKAIFAEKEKGLRVTKRIIDRHFAQVRTLNTKRTLLEELLAAGLVYEPSYESGLDEPELETGIIKVRSYLNYDATRAIDTLNRPKYMVSPTCHNTIKGFTRWAIDPKTGKPADAYKDFMDTVRYAVMANPAPLHVPPRRPAVRRFG